MAPGGWRLYHSEGSAGEPPVHKKVTLDHVRLLTAQDDVAARTMVEDLGQFCEAVQRHAEMLLGQSEAAFEVLVQFKCAPSGHEVQMSHQGEVNEKLLQGLYGELAAIEKLSVKHDDVTFQMHIRVGP